ncbi:DUF6053 domain-containing protein [Lysobacter enzymogenes]|uniref:DUF6053 domain-containing protein n=1 Tax=Lysobacter enzymogenes TaxID=69 RepID=UPI003D18B35D
MEGASVPTLSTQAAAICNQSLGTEVPPTTAQSTGIGLHLWEGLQPRCLPLRPPRSAPQASPLNPFDDHLPGGYSGGSGEGRCAGPCRQCGPCANAARRRLRASTPSPPPQRARRRACTASRWAGSARRSTSSSSSAAGGLASPRRTLAICSKSPRSISSRKAGRFSASDAGGAAPAAAAALGAAAAIGRGCARSCSAHTRVPSHSSANSTAAIAQPLCTAPPLPVAAASIAAGGASAPASALPPAPRAAATAGLVGAAWVPPMPWPTVQLSGGRVALRAARAFTSHQSRRRPSRRTSPSREGTSENLRLSFTRGRPPTKVSSAWTGSANTCTPSIGGSCSSGICARPAPSTLASMVRLAELPTRSCCGVER